MRVQDKSNLGKSKSSLTELLKSETLRLHNALEVEMNSAELFKANVDKLEYTKHLTLLSKGHLSVMTQLEHFENDTLVKKYLTEERYTLMALESDLKDLPNHSGTFTATSHFLHSNENAYGALYVVLGSNMGRSFIGKKLRETIQDWHKSAPEYYAPNACSTEVFQLFKTDMNAMDADQFAKEEVIQGAKATFSCFITLAKEMKMRNE